MPTLHGQFIKMLTQFIILICKLDMLHHFVFMDDLLFIVTDVFENGAVFLIEDLEGNIAIGDETELH